MIRLSIKRKIIGIAVVLIVLMAVTALVSMALVLQVGNRLEDLTQRYVPAYGALARANIRSVERALALRSMIIEKPNCRQRWPVRRGAQQFRCQRRCVRQGNQDGAHLDRRPDREGNHLR